MTTIVGGNMEANITGTTSLTGIGDISITQNGIDASLITLKSEYTKDDIVYKGEIKLDGNVTVTGTSKLIGETRIADDTITLDTHTHGSNNVNQANTAGPNTN
jgi:hypothetical protein